MWILGTSFVLVVMMCLGLAWIFQRGAKYDPAEYPTNLTHSVLKAAATHQNILPPTDLPADIKAIDKACWNFLKETMDKNQNQYRLETQIYGDYGTPDLSNMTGSDEVVVRVIFQDESKAELYFYNSFLEECRELTNETIPFFQTSSRAS